MSGRYPGGIIRGTPLVPTTLSASGVWTLKEALQAQAQGIWPLNARTIAFGGTFSSDTNIGASASYTFNTIGISTANADRLVVAGFSGFELGGPASVTIGGISASSLVSPTTSNGIYFWGAYVPTGTTATIVITLGGGGAANRCYGGAWAVYGTRGDPTITGSDVEDEGNNNISRTLDIPVNANGVAIAIGHRNNSTTAIATSGTGVNEDYDVASEATHRVAGASGTSVAAGNISITMNPVTSFLGIGW